MLYYKRNIKHFFRIDFSYTPTGNTRVVFPINFFTRVDITIFNMENVLHFLNSKLPIRFASVVIFGYLLLALAQSAEKYVSHYNKVIIILTGT